MRKTGAWLVRYALEQVGVRYTFGIPGVHNTELYDELNASPWITPILVTHEVGAAFMADAVSRTSNSVGCQVVVPAAGLTHAASGIGEAFLDGIPMLVISGGIHRASGRAYQLHDIDQQALMAPITKASYRLDRHDRIVETVFEAYETATTGEPGPVYLELPIDIGTYTAEVPGTLPSLRPRNSAHDLPLDDIAKAAALLRDARKPAIFAGWGARGARDELRDIAERLNAPVATTLQGLSSFPAEHPLHTGMSFGAAAVPAARNAFADCDCLLAVGTRFAEIATGSYSVTVPQNLIHVDINPKVFSANYPAKVAIEGNAKTMLGALRAQLTARPQPGDLAGRIATDKAGYRQEWREHSSRGRVNPVTFFDALHAALPNDAIVVADDGNHTFLTAELLPFSGERRFISPSDFNSMGYAVPAAIGAKLANPDKTVVAIVGDGAFLMTGMELLTATAHRLGIVVFIFNDGELSQISQAQSLPYKHKTCTRLTPVHYTSIAEAVGAVPLNAATDAQVEAIVSKALHAASEGGPVLVDVKIDYSKMTAFTKGAMKAILGRVPTVDKFRMGARMIGRRLTG